MGVFFGLTLVFSLACFGWAEPKTVSFVDGTFDLDQDGLSELLMITHNDEDGSVLEFVEIDKAREHQMVWSFAPGMDAKAVFTDVKLLDLDTDGMPELVATLQHSFNGSEFNQPWLFIFRWTGETFTAVPSVIEDPRLDGKFVRPGNLSFWKPITDKPGWITVSMGSPLRSILLLELDTNVFPWKLTGRELLQPILFKNGYGRVYTIAFTSNQQELLALVSPEGQKLNAVIYDFDKVPTEVASAVITGAEIMQILAPDLQTIDLNVDGNEEILLPFSNGIVKQLVYEADEITLEAVNMAGDELFVLPDPATSEDINNLVVTRVEQGLYSTVVAESAPPGVADVIVEPEPVFELPRLPEGVFPIDTVVLGGMYSSPAIIDEPSEFYSFQWLEEPPEGCSFNPENFQIEWEPAIEQLGGHVLAYKLEFRLGEKVIMVAENGGFRHQTIPVLSEELVEYGLWVADSTTLESDDIYFDDDDGIQFYSVAALIPEKRDDNRFVFRGVPPFGLATMEFDHDTMIPSLMHSISANLSHITTDKKIEFSYSSATPIPQDITTFQVTHDIDNKLMTLAFKPGIEDIHQSLHPEDLFSELYQFPEYFFSGFPEGTGIDLLGDKLQFTIADDVLRDDAQLSFVGITSPTSPAHLLTMYFNQGELQAVRGEIKIQPTGGKKVITEFDFAGNFNPIRISAQLRLPGTLAIPSGGPEIVEPVELAFEPPPPRQANRRTVDEQEIGTTDHSLGFAPGQYVKIYNDQHFDLSHGNMTLEGYIRVGSEMNSEVIISKEGDFNLQLSEQGELQFWTGRTDSTGVLLTGFSPLPVDEWVHFAAVQDSNGMRLYQAGTLIAENNQAGPIYYSTSSIVMGSREFFTGGLNEIRLSDTARYLNKFDPEERFLTDDNTIGLWHCDRGTGLMLFDASGYDITGELFGVQWNLLEEATTESEIEEQPE